MKKEVKGKPAYKLVKTYKQNVESGSQLKIELQASTDALNAGFQNQSFLFNNVVVEEEKEEVAPEVKVKTLQLATSTDDRFELNKIAYELKMNKANLEIVTEEASAGKDLVINVYSKNEKKYHLAQVTLVGYSTYLKDHKDSFVDLTEVKDLAELDKPELKYAKEAIINALASGKLSGDENGFRPNDSINRAEFAKMLVELSGMEINKDAKEDFKDVDGEWFAPYVATLQTAKIAEGNGDGMFRPYDAITRQEAAVMIAAYINAGTKLDAFNSTTGKAVDSKTKFADDKQIDTWADGAVKVLQIAEISNGDQNKNFNPQNNITRAETVVMVNRAEANKSKTTDIKAETANGAEATATFTK